MNDNNYIKYKKSTGPIYYNPIVVPRNYNFFLKNLKKENLIDIFNMYETSISKIYLCQLHIYYAAI